VRLGRSGSRFCSDRRSMIANRRLANNGTDTDPLSTQPGPRPCENFTRYNRTRNFEACRHAQSKKMQKNPPPLSATTKLDFVFTRPRPLATDHVLTADGRYRS
jgi:hypothetical protein